MWGCYTICLNTKSVNVSHPLELKVIFFKPKAIKSSLIRRKKTVKRHENGVNAVLKDKQNDCAIANCSGIYKKD